MSGTDPISESKDREQGKAAEAAVLSVQTE